MSKTKKHNGTLATDSYMTLVTKFPLASIKNDAQLKDAQAVIDSLLGREPLDEGEEMYLEALTEHVQIYEEKSVHIDEPSDGAVLKHIMAAKGVSQTKISRGADI